MLLAWCALACQPPSPPAPTPVFPPAGEEARVLTPLGTTASFGADRKALDEYRAAQIADLATPTGPPGTTAAAIRNAGRYTEIANQTRVLILEQDVDQVRVRVLDGPLAGREGWVYLTSVARPRTSTQP